MIQPHVQMQLPARDAAELRATGASHDAWPAVQCRPIAPGSCVLGPDATDPDSSLEGMVLWQDAVPWPAKVLRVAADICMMLACNAALTMTAVLACLLTLLGFGEVHSAIMNDTSSSWAAMPWRLHCCRDAQRRLQAALRGISQCSEQRCALLSGRAER